MAHARQAHSGSSTPRIGFNTASAAQFTTDQPLVVEAGQTLKIGTCGLPGSTGVGDTFLRLFGPDSQEVASNDDACGTTLSNTSFTVPAGTGGNYTIRV